MDWRQIAVIWLLSVLIGGLAITGIVLWCHRDKPAHRRPSYLSRLNGQAILERWRASVAAARDQLEARGLPPARFRDDVLSADDLATLEYGSEHARAFREGDRSRICPECGIGWARESPGCPHRLWDMHPRPRPQPTLSERVSAYYSAAEERLTQQLLDAGAARWRA